MYRSDIEIKEGALVVSDAHYSDLRPQLLEFLKAIESKELKATQLILMGDIFDALFGEVSYTHLKNKKALDTINNISKDIEVIYLEGNHDFNLKKIFPMVKVFGIKQQPLECTYNGKRVLLAHGDFGSRVVYRIYTALIRNTFIMSFLSILNTLSKNAILDKLDNYLSKKDDCKEFTNFREFVSNRLENRYECEYFIEGHFHQNKSIGFKKIHYMNLGAFACNQRYFIVKCPKDVELLEERSFSQGI